MEILETSVATESFDTEINDDLGAEGVADLQDVNVEEPVAGEEPQMPQIPNEVWQVSRQRAEREAQAGVQSRIDSVYKDLFAGVVNPMTGKAIESEAEYKALIEYQQKEAQTQAFQQAGISEDLLNNLIAQHPMVKRASEVVQQADKVAGEKQLESKVAEITKLDPNIKTVEDLFKMPNIDKFNELVLKRGYDFVDAYKLVQFDSITKNSADSAQQEAIKKITQNAIASPGSLGTNKIDQPIDFESMDDEQFEAYVRAAKRGELRK